MKRISINYSHGALTMIDKSSVIKKLKEIYEPCMPVIDIVEMGLIYDIKIKKNSVYILMTFSTPHCPAGFRMIKMVEDKVKTLNGVEEVHVELTFNPPWTKDRLSENNRKKLGFI